MERTLLLVDDEENITSALTRLLRRDGYQILRANSGAEGLEILAKTQVGVIISDQRMPNMTGVEFLGKVKELYPDTVRMVLSGYTELNSVTDAINRGAVYKFFTKPWDDELLRANVEEAFQRYEMRRENARLNQELLKANAELTEMNRNLEQRVTDKTREIMLNVSMLKVSQEILELLPVAVVGIGDDGLIAVANRRALELFSAGGAHPMLGESAQAAIPADVWQLVTECDQLEEKRLVTLPDGRSFGFWCGHMGESSSSKGMIMVIDTCCGKHV